MKKRRILLALLPFTLLFVGTWLANLSSPYAHLSREGSGTPVRVLAEVEGTATGLNADWVCLQDTLHHHAGNILRADGHAISERMALDLCCAPELAEVPPSEARFRLKMDFIHFGEDASLGGIRASLRESGLQLRNLERVGNEVRGEIFGLLDHPDHPGEKVRVEGGRVRFKAFSLEHSVG